MRETFESEFVRCGKAGCRTCPHGPYWYAYRREGGKVKKRYVGKRDPRRAEGEGGTPAKADPREAIFSSRTATIALAEAILGVTARMGKDKCFSAWKMLVLMNHPDRGGDQREMQFINSAWSYMKAFMEWR